MNRSPLVCLLIVVALMAPAAASAAEPPRAITGGVSGLESKGATLNGVVNPNGAAVASCRFEFGTTSAYGAVSPCVPASLGAGSFNVSVSAQVTSLEPGTTYHYRLTATSVNGATSGIDRTFTTLAAPQCSNVARRLEQGIAAVQLPACMALEQVNPSQKFSQRALAPTISADGERVGYLSLASLVDTPGNISTFNGPFYVATRGKAEWESESTSPPSPVVSGWTGGRTIARSFDPSLTNWFVLGGSSPETWAGVSRAYHGSLGGAFQPLSTTLLPLGSHPGQVNPESAQLQAASADHSRLLFSMGDATTTYLPDDPTPTAGADPNVYIAHLDGGGQPSLSLLARDEVEPNAGKAWGGNCGTRVGGNGGTGNGWRYQGAVSSDGGNVYFSTRPDQAATGSCDAGANKLRIMRRTEAAGIADAEELFQSQCTRVSPVCSTANGDDLYQGASVDGSKVYFTTNRQLANSDLDGIGINCLASAGIPGCDLYLYDSVAEKLVQVSAGEANASHPVVGEGANVFDGTVAISGDGSRVYFAAAGVLTTDPNPAGQVASSFPASDPKLYVWNAGTGDTAFVGPLSPTDSGLWGGEGSFLNQAYAVPVTGADIAGTEVGGDGHILVFQTRSSLASVDTDGGRLDAYRYDGSANSLQCVSCRSGGPDSDPVDIDTRTVIDLRGVGTAFAEQGRWVSEDGKSILVRTSEPLLPTDLDQGQNDYLWREGQFSLLPGTTPPPGTGSAFNVPPVLSHDGSEVAFTAFLRLLPSDIDSAPSVYVARVDGGFESPRGAPSCVGEAGCRPPALAGPTEPNVPSSSFAGPGNVKPKPPVRPCPKGKHREVRRGKSVCVKNSKRKGSSKKRANSNKGGRK